MMKRWVLGVVIAMGVLSGSAPAQEPPAWFEGTINERVTFARIPNMVLSTAIRTTLSATRIRRETSLQVAKISTGTAGIIVDLDKKEAILYRSDLLQKFYCTLTLAELDTVLHREKLEDFIGGRERGYSRMFLPLMMYPYTVETTKDALTVQERLCDRNVVNQGIRRWRIASCREIRVPEALVHAAYPRIPKELTGYPLEIIGEVLRDPTKWQGIQIPPWLQKAFETLDKVNDALSLQEISASEIKPGKVPADAFTLDPSFKKLDTLEELDAKFPEGKRKFDD